MSDPSNFKDPFTPETVRLQAPSGEDFIDLLATVANHAEAPLPAVNSSFLRSGDVITIEFDDDREETVVVDSLRIKSLVFGSDEVRSPSLTLNRVAPDTEDDGSHTITLIGSAISPGGGMMTPGTIRTSSYMVTDQGISTGTIRNFDLKRPNENGELKPVMLNKTETKEPSEGFAKARATFDELEALLREDGFTFDQEGEDGLLRDRYKKVIGDRLVYAARQGFGCAVVPQDEIWVYDAKEEVLRVMRNIPSLGIFQAAVAEGVTKDIFQKAGNGYRQGSIPDWREPYLDKTHIHWLSDHVPVTSYTWLTPDQDAPIITVLEDGKNLGSDSIFRTPKKKPSMSPEIARSLGIDPNEDNHHYNNVEVNIYPGKPPTQNGAEEYLWESEELAEEFVRKAQDSISIRHKKDVAILTVDNHDIPVRTNIGREIEKMAKAARLALGSTQRTIGTSVLRRLRK